MKRIGVTVLLIVWCAFGCSDPVQTGGDPTITARYSVANASSTAVLVEAAGPVSNHLGQEIVRIGTGETREIVGYEYFLAPVPDAAKDLWCVSMRREADRELVKQLCPVANAQWSVTRPRKYTWEFVHTIRDVDLVPMGNTCPRLEGVIRSAETGVSIANARVLLFMRPIIEVYYTDEGGAYGAWLPKPLPSGDIEISAPGYETATVDFRSALVHQGENFYRIDFDLSPQEPAAP